MLKRSGFLCLKVHHYFEYPLRPTFFPPVSLSQISQRSHGTLYPGTDVTAEEAWKRRIQLRQPKLQCDEQIRPKLYYAPEWDLEKRHDGEEGEAHPMIGQDVMTPEKWNYYNKVVWPPNYVSPETGLPLLRQVYYCRESVHCSPKRMFMACHLVWRLNVDEAMEQLRLQRKKACMILRQALIDAKKKASAELHIEFPSDMHVAEAFPIQCQIVKGYRRHARERITITRYRYINIFVSAAAAAYKLASKVPALRASAVYVYSSSIKTSSRLNSNEHSSRTSEITTTSTGTNTAKEIDDDFSSKSHSLVFEEPLQEIEQEEFIALRTKSAAKGRIQIETEYLSL
ncbi:unnamed protein product [Onchocerca ochengi]|uniref:Large ribosomal subunit protein uL22m n=1 Tax=Onchocerca ochengi TaxID=42157 RepID=A0A182E9R4_ONCOC|nr:unnamed protein product [Onchocerca ochengi]